MDATCAEKARATAFGKMLKPENGKPSLATTKYPNISREKSAAL
jgi:hypothetical protein